MTSFVNDGGHCYMPMYAANDVVSIVLNTKDYPYAKRGEITRLNQNDVEFVKSEFDIDFNALFADEHRPLYAYLCDKIYVDDSAMYVATVVYDSGEIFNW